MRQSEIVGSWSLESFEITRPDGTKKPWAEKCHGLLIYTPEGTMSVAINNVAEIEIDPNARLGAILFYSGTYVVQDQIIIHHVSQASDAERIGSDLTREAQLVGTRLTLTGRGPFGVAQLVWRRK